MEIAGRVLVLVHLIGFAALFGGLVIQLRDLAPDVNAAMLYGAWLELLTGGGLVVWLLLGHTHLNYPQLATKLVLTLLIVLLVGKNRKYQSIPRGLWAILSTLTMINTGVAVLWQ
jgi:hypothetical protein